MSEQEMPAPGSYFKETETLTGNWCLATRDPHDGKGPVPCTRPEGHAGAHVAGDSGQGGYNGAPRILLVVDVWP